MEYLSTVINNSTNNALAAYVSQQHHCEMFMHSRLKLVKEATVGFPLLSHISASRIRYISCRGDHNRQFMLTSLWRRKNQQHCTQHFRPFEMLAYLTDLATISRLASKSYRKNRKQKWTKQTLITYIYYS